MKYNKWQFMVVRRHYHDGRYGAVIVKREDFRRKDYPQNRERYRQEFYPCTDMEKAVRATMDAVFLSGKGKHKLKQRERHKEDHKEPIK